MTPDSNARPEPFELAAHKLAEIRQRLADLRAQEEVLCALRRDCENKCDLSEPGTPNDPLNQSEPS